MKCKIVLVLVLLFLSLFSCRKLDMDNARNNSQQEEWDPRNVSRNYTQSFAPHIAVADDGTIYLAWMDGTKSDYGGIGKIYFRYRSPDGNWSEIEILSDTSRDAWLCGGCMLDPSGNLHIVWDEYNDKPRICHRVLNTTSGGGWSSTEYLAIGHMSRLAIDPSGTIHVVYQPTPDYPAAREILYYIHKPPGGEWSAPESVPGGRVNYDLAVDHEGGVHIVVFPGNDWGPINYIYRSPDGRWYPPVNVASTRDRRLCACVAVNNSGKVWVSWVNIVHREYFIPCYSYKMPSGEWSIPDTVPDILTAYFLNIEFDPLGNLHYIWGPGDDIFHRVYTKDGVWTPIINVSNNPETGSVSPMINFGPLGIYIVWVEREWLDRPVYDAIWINREIYLQILSQ